MTWLLILPALWLTFRWYLLIDRWAHEARSWWRRRKSRRAHAEWLEMGYAEVRPGEYMHTREMSHHQKLGLAGKLKLRRKTISMDSELTR